MQVRKLIPRVSLRTLFVVTAVTAVATQAAVCAMNRQLEKRRQAFISNAQELVVASRREPIYSDRFLSYIERTIAEKDAAFLPPLKRRQLVQMVTGERMRQTQSIAAATR